MTDRELLYALLRTLRHIQEAINAIDNQYRTERHPQEAPRQVDIQSTIRLAPVVEGYYASEQQERLQKSRIDLVRLALEGIGVIAAITAVIYTFQTLNQVQRQANAAERSLKTSIESFRIDERAWIGFSFSEGNITFTQGKSFSVPTELINTGKTPARRIAGHVIVRVVTKGEPLDFDYTPGRVNTAYLINAGTIFPGGAGIKESFEALAHGRKEALILTKPIMDDILAARSFVVVYGDITYVDIFGIDHWTYYCRYVTAPSLISEQCIKYNDTDNNK